MSRSRIITYVNVINQDEYSTTFEVHTRDGAVGTLEVDNEDIDWDEDDDNWENLDDEDDYDDEDEDDDEDDDDDDIRSTPRLRR